VTLGEKQRLFVKLSAEFDLWCYAQGYELTDGEAYRTPEQAALNAANGSGISNSLHTKRLARDKNLFIAGVYQTTSEAHRPLGEYWKSLDPLCRWGGDFRKPDGNHYSMEFQGIQ